MLADVLICGPSDSGKTTLVGQLVAGKAVETYTSMVENSFPWQVEGRPDIRLVDVPGSERVRVGLIDQFSPSARALLYVVDSNTVGRQVRDVAEFLHSVLASPAVAANRPPLLVFCNKQDGSLAKGALAIQALLEKEIEKVGTP